jgi:hypothetical protein
MNKICNLAEQLLHENPVRRGFPERIPVVFTGVSEERNEVSFNKLGSNSQRGVSLDTFKKTTSSDVLERIIKATTNNTPIQGWIAVSSGGSGSIIGADVARGT